MLETYGDRSFAAQLTVKRGFVHSEIGATRRSQNGQSRDEFGPRNNMNTEARDALCQKRLDGLGVIEFGRIEIAPFSIEKFGVTFGLIPKELEDEDDELLISLEPGDYMAFYEPWDSGDYDTWVNT